MLYVTLQIDLFDLSSSWADPCIQHVAGRSVLCYRLTPRLFAWFLRSNDAARAFYAKAVKPVPGLPDKHGAGCEQWLAMQPRLTALVSTAISLFGNKAIDDAMRDEKAFPSKLPAIDMPLGEFEKMMDQIVARDSTRPANVVKLAYPYHLLADLQSIPVGEPAPAQEKRLAKKSRATKKRPATAS